MKPIKNKHENNDIIPRLLLICVSPYPREVCFVAKQTSKGYSIKRLPISQCGAFIAQWLIIQRNGYEKSNFTIFSIYQTKMKTKFCFLSLKKLIPVPQMIK